MARAAAPAAMTMARCVRRAGGAVAAAGTARSYCLLARLRSLTARMHFQQIGVNVPFFFGNCLTRWVLGQAMHFVPGAASSREL